MNYLFIMLLMLIGYSTTVLGDDFINSKDANKISSEYYEKQTKAHIESCKRGVNYQIKEAAKYGNFFIHIINHSCYGDMLENVAKELNKKGFKTNIAQAGIHLVHYVRILTVAW